MEIVKCVSVMKGKFGKIKKYMIQYPDGKEVDCLPQYVINQINSGAWGVSNLQLHNNKLKIIGPVNVIKIR